MSDVYEDLEDIILRGESPKHDLVKHLLSLYEVIMKMNFPDQLLNSEIHDPLFIQRVYLGFVILGFLNQVILVVEENIAKGYKKLKEFTECRLSYSS